MKRVFIAGLLVSSAAFAGDFFVGADVGSSRVTIDGSLSGTVTSYGTTRSVSESTSASDSSGTQGLKIGYYLNDNNRIYASFERVNVEDATMNNYGLSYDYIAGSGALRPFFGLGIGATSFKTDYMQDVLVKDELDLTGMTYSARVGVNYKIIMPPTIQTEKPVADIP